MALRSDPSHLLRKLFKDAHSCEASSIAVAIEWANNLPLWAEHQIKYRGWSYLATEATVREGRRLLNRIEAADQ